MGETQGTKPSAADSTSPDVWLRALSENSPGGPRWKLDLQRLQASLGRSKDASVIPGLLALARAQRRSEFLALAEACLRTQVYDPAALAAIWRELQRSYPYLRECLRAEDATGRAAAARLLSSFSDENGLNAAAIDWALRWEKDAFAAAVMIACLHGLRRDHPAWPPALRSFQTAANPASLRFQAACCRLDSESAAAPDVIAELSSQLYGADGQALPSLRAIAVYAVRLPRAESAALWAGLLEAVEEFDGAAEIACWLLRAVTGDRREGWGQVRLTSRTTDGGTVPPPGVVLSAMRLAYAGLFQKVTGRKVALSLPCGQVPAREYPEVRAFPPVVDLQDPIVRRALQAMTGCDPLWRGRTDLWRLFGLPARRLELRLLTDASLDVG